MLCMYVVVLGVKDLAANVGDIRDAGSIPESGRSPGGGNSNPLCFLAWKIPWTEEPGGLQSMRSQSWTQQCYAHNWY